MSHRAPGGDVCRPRTAGRGAGGVLQDRGRKQSSLILDITLNQTATILPKTSVFKKIYKPKWEEKRQKERG